MRVEAGSVSWFDHEAEQERALTVIEIVIRDEEEAGFTIAPGDRHALEVVHRHLIRLDGGDQTGLKFGAVGGLCDLCGAEVEDMDSVADAARPEALQDVQPICTI